MLKFTLALGFFFCLLSSSWAQNQIPNGDFEDWSSDALNLYEFPSSGWWSTLNPLRTLGGPVSVTKDADAYAGNYSARLETFEYGTLLVPGILLSGTFNLLNSPDFFTQGRPYTDKPAEFSGWYKYSPVQGDSAAIAVQVTKWNTTTLQRDTLAEAGIVITQAVPNWTQFILPLTYSSAEIPDTLVVVATSSAAGDQLIGEIGSTLWVDEFDLTLATNVTSPVTNTPKVKIITGQNWWLEVAEEPVWMEVYNLNGTLMMEGEYSPGRHDLNTTYWPAGVYAIRVTNNQGNQLVQKSVLYR